MCYVNLQFDSKVNKINFQVLIFKRRKESNKIKKNKYRNNYKNHKETNYCKQSKNSDSLLEKQRAIYLEGFK